MATNDKNIERLKLSLNTSAAQKSSSSSSSTHSAAKSSSGSKSSTTDPRVEQLKNSLKNSANNKNNSVSVRPKYSYTYKTQPVKTAEQLAYEKDYEEKSKYDIAAGQKEIESLEEQLKQLRDSKATAVNPVNGMPYAVGQQAVYTEEYAPAANNANGMPYAVYQQANYAPVDTQAAELSQEILRKKQYLNQAKQIQRKIAFESAAGNIDFGKKSVYNPYSNADDDLYNWINDEQFREEYEGKHNEIYSQATGMRNDGTKKSRFALSNYNQLDKDEIKLYNYYYATQGAEKAQEYLDTIQEDLNMRSGKQIAEKYKGKTGAEIFFGVATGFDQFGSGMRGAISGITGKEDYIPQSQLQYAGQLVREDLADNVRKLPSWMGGGSLAQAAYDLTSTIANMAPSILASAVLSPAAGSALMGTSAAGNAYQTALNAGYDKNAARAYGVAIGVAETAMQSLLGGISSLGGVSPAVTKAVEGIDNGLLRFMAQYGASMASEGLEEGLQEILDPILQNAIMGADENVDWANVVYSALLGAASAGVLEIGGNLRQSRQEAAAKREYGSKTDELIAEGLGYEDGTEANEIAQQYKARVDSGKSLTGAQIKHQLEANEVQQVETAARERLVELGETDDPAEIAKLATKRAMGETLNPSEKSRLARSKFGAQVAKELVPETVAKGKAVEAMTRPGKYKPLDTRVEADVSERVSESGKNELADSGKEFDLKQIDAKTGSDGKLVWTVDGQEATSDNIKFKDEDTAYIFQAVENIENITPTAAPVLVRSVDTNKDITKQLNGLDEAYTYGRNGYTVEDMNAGEFVSELTDTQKMDAFRLGEAARKNRTDTRVESIKKMRTAAETEAANGNKPKLKITYDHGNGKVEDFKSKDIKGLTGKQRAAVEVAEMLHKLGIGTDFEFFSTYLSKTLKDPKTGKAARVFLDENGNEVAAYAGVYMGAGGKIRIDLNAYNGRRLALNAMSHELVHFVQDWSPEKYQAMAEFLANAYGKTELSMHQRVLREQARLKKIRNQDVPYAEAYDEVVANALNKMFDDGTIMTKLAELRSKDAALADKIIEGIRIIADRLLEVFNQNQYLYHDTYDLMQMGDTFKQIREMFAEALVDASDNLQAARIVKEAFGENANVETNENGELLLATNENNSVVMYSEQTYLNGGRDKLETALRQNGHTEAEITETLSYVDDALDYIRVLAAGYAKQMGYTNLSEHLIADVITNVKTGKQVMSSIVNNGDYPVNIDLSLICKKRVAYMNLMSRLIRDGIFDKVNYDGAAIAEVNGILRENGFETACLGCFVESRRLQFQTWAETIVAEWNAEVEKRNPNADNFGFAKGDMKSLSDSDINALTRELESAKKNDQGNVNLGQGNSVTKMGRLLDTLPSLQKKLTVEDLLTPEGLTALRQHDGSLFSIVKSRYGAASPKIVQDFNPYASEIAMLTFAQVKGITNNAVKGAQTYVKEVKSEYGKIVRANGESKENFNKRKKLHEQRIQDEAMRRYLYDIGGARIQSFSDFMIENVFDYIQIFADLSAKRLPLHGYTKEIVCMRLFGMTGAKWNGSLIAHVERSMGKELAGLLPAGTKDGIPVKVNGKDYVIGFDDYARNAATNGKSFIQSIGMKDILALQLDPRYSPYVGNITIGVSDAQITAMLDSPLFRMVIPYHASGMLPMFAKLVGVDMYNDYTDYQNTTVRQYYDLDGNAVSELKNAKGDAVKADTSFAFNAEIQKTKDAKIAAKNYLNWCAQRHEVYDGKTLVGYATFNPKFSSSPYGTDFTRHENYYKLLEDFNTYDCVTEESTVQGGVTMNFPSEENRLSEEQMAEYKNALRETGVFTAQDIEKYAKKADMTFKEIIAAEVGNRANYAATQAPKWESTVKEVEAKLQKDYSRNQYSSQETDADSISVNDVVTMSDGSLAVNINSKTSGLVAHKKGEWPSVIAKQIKSALSGKSIYAADGDIITITNRGAREVAYGDNTRNLKEEARNSGDYSAVERKMFTAEHAATIIALSVYKSWSKNTDPTDGFKRDGLNHRTVRLLIDGDPYVATVLTALSADETDKFSYGEKFYDILGIEKQTNQSATSGDTNTAPIPHKIKFADDSSDKLTVTQKNRIVNRKNAKYAIGDADTTTALAAAFANAKSLNSTQETDSISNRSLLANAFETISRSSVEYGMIQDYKRNIDKLNKLENELSDVNAEIRQLRFGKDVERDPDRLRELENKSESLAKEINKYDKRLINMEASEPLRKVLDRERKKARQETIKRTKEIQQNRKLRKEQTELRKRIRRTIMDLDKILNKGDKKRNVKEGMRDFASKALASAEVLFTDNYSEDDMIRNGVSVTMEKWENDLMKETKNLFDQIDLIYKNAETTEEVNRVIAGDTQSYEARMETLNKLDQKIAENKRKLKGVFARERVRLNETTISSVLNELASEYRKLGSSDDLYIRGATNEDVYQHLLSLSEEVGGTVVNDMTLNQLEAVYNAYKMVLTTVRKANQMFNKEIKESIQQMGSAVIGEVQKAGGVHGDWTSMEKKINEASWNNTKPIWIANRIKSATFEKLMHGLFEGQYQYAVDVDEAKKYKQMADKKFKPRKWDAQKLHTFKTPNGEEFQLNLQQIMSLYAYSKRDQSYSHLLNGGFVFSNQTKVVSDKSGIKKTFLRDSAKAFKLNQNVLSEIISTLSDDQKAYVDSMQAYLSETMGAKGNEVSMEMLGVKLFNERFYFPLRSSGAYMEKAKEAELKKQQGQINIASSGFTHSTKPEAKNPVILDGFLDVWAEHCVEMSMYHSMVLPMEDFRRVYNYKNVADTEVDARSVFQTIQDAYGSAATNYIDQLYRELNAGATIDPRETSAKARISKFKKSAVKLSSSVVVQQFSSIGRAFDVIDPKFFAGEKVKSTKMKAADEMKKYAPVAVIKEIGGFDTGIKGSAKTYIMAENYDKGERVKGFMSDEQYRGDLTGFAPAKADEITWTAIWEAAKRETHARNPEMDVESEAFLKLAGNRFSEAIEKTQVYDSVLARSANMRSKSALMSMATAFMAEPTTTINLLEDAIRSKKAKNIARAFGSVAASILLNNALASVVYAMRDDDEDETFVEKYFQSFVSGMIDDINPMSYYPYLKDVYSLFQGYDVERADMSVITDLRDAVKKAVPLMGKDVSEMSDEELSAHWKNVNSVIMSILDTGFAMFGVSEKNIRRDAASIINTYKTIRKDIAERDTTWMSFWDKVGAAAKDTIPVYAWTKDKPKSDMLYDAIVAGDNVYLNRLKNSYKDEKAYTNAVRKSLRENDERISEAAQALYENNAAEYKRIYQQIRSENKFSADDILSAIDSEAAAIQKDTEGGGESAPYIASDFVKAVIVGDSATAKTMRNEYISFKVSGGVSRDDAEKKFQDSVQSSVNDAYKENLLTASAAKKMLIDYAGKDESEAEDRVTYWEFKRKYPQYNLSDDAVWDYYDIAEPLGIGLRDYVDFVDGKKDIETKRDANGKIIYSSRDQTVDLIHSLNLTDDQKDALYILEGYSKNKLWDTPWH